MATLAKPRHANKRVAAKEQYDKTTQHPKNGDEIWDELLVTPESDAFLRLLSQQAHEDYLVGNTEAGGFSDEAEDEIKA
ncbi:MAG: hypothetical protein ACOVSW_04885 [Candidatus Kapaibacteriota bacterium]|jgi:hypothetical protein